MPPKEQRVTTPEAALENNTLKNTPIKANQNADYCPDLTDPLMFHIRQNIFNTGQITLEPAFYEIFLNKAL